MNAHLLQNQQMRLPCGNTTPVNPVRIQYVLRGVYFHQSTDYSNDGIPNWSVHNTHAVNPNTEINIYHINNPSQSADGVAPGIGVTNNLRTKIWKDYAEYPTTITIAPNPAKGMVEVTYQVTANSDYQLSLVSIFGEQLEVLEQGNSIVNEKRNLRFDSSSYPSGVYVIVLTTDKGKQAKQLIIAK